MAKQIERQFPWTMICADNEVEDDLVAFVGLLPATNVEESGETGLYASIGIPGRRLPITQYVRGETQTFSFEAFYINDPTVDPNDGRHTVSKARSLLKRAAAPHRNLYRPPLYSFSLGEDGAIQFDCFVESIGSISYSDLVTPYGEPLHASFSIRLRIVENTQVDLKEVIEVPKELEWYLMTLDETHEEAAGKKYNDPMLGVPLRQQSTVAFPGSIPLTKVQERRIKLPDSWELSKLGVEPASPALQFARADSAAAFHDIYARRSAQLQPARPPGLPAIQRFRLPTP